MSKLKVLVILGPTASGKTALSLLLAKKINGEIISADSRQIYRGMTIGTAKPPQDKKNGLLRNSAIAQELSKPYLVHDIKHYLVDIKNPDQDYSVGQFKTDAERAIAEIIERGRLPIVVGGSAQYIYALVDNWQIPEVKANPALRKKLEKEIADHGLELVYKKLLALDPEAAYVVDPKNPRRVVRALEVAISTGQPFTAQRRAVEPMFDCLLIGINPANPATAGRGAGPGSEILKNRIAQRVKKMLKAGLVKEVQSLLKTYGHKQKVLDTIGYREIIEYLDNKTTLAQAEQKIISNTNHFARRQMQWFKRDKQINWIKDLESARETVKKFLLN